MTPDKPDTKPTHDELAEQMAEYVKRKGPVVTEPIKEYTMEELQATLGYPISSRNRRKDQK